MDVYKWIAEHLRSYLQKAFRSFVQASSASDHLEVERKFSINDREAQELPGRLMGIGFSPIDAVEMKDYFLPVSMPGEMMRVRLETSRGDTPHAVLTLKSWAQTKDGGRERTERERKAGTTVGWLWILCGRLIKGSSLLSFSKIRELYEGVLAERPCIVSIDRVSGLGVYSGFYLEIEVIMPAGATVRTVRDEIYALAGRLLTEPQDVQRSYLDMLVESQEPV